MSLFLKVILSVLTHILVALSLRSSQANGYLFLEIYHH